MKPAPKIFYNLSGPEGVDLTLKGDCIFKCPIQKGMTITVIDGKAQFDAKIGEGATIISKSSEAKTASEGSVVGGSFNSVNIAGGNNRVIVNGKDITKQVSKNSAPNAGVIEVNAPVGSNVTLKADAKIEVNTPFVGDGFTADAGGSVTVQSVRDHARLNAGASVNFKKIGSYSIVSAGASIKGDFVGKNCELDAGASIKINNDVYDYSALDAGASIKAKRAFKQTAFDAGASVKVDAADHSATFNAGASVKVGKKQYLSVGDDGKAPKTPRKRPQDPKVVDLFKNKK